MWKRWSWTTSNSTQAVFFLFPPTLPTAPVCTPSSMDNHSVPLPHCFSHYREIPPCHRPREEKHHCQNQANHLSGVKQQARQQLNWMDDFSEVQHLFSPSSLKWSQDSDLEYSSTIPAGQKIFAKSQGILLLDFLPFLLRIDFNLFLQTCKQQLLLIPVTNILHPDLCQTSCLPDLKCLWPCFLLN